MPTPKSAAKNVSLILAQLSCSLSVPKFCARVWSSPPGLAKAARGFFSLAADPEWAADPVQASAPVSAPVSCPAVSVARHYPDSAATADSGDLAVVSPAAGAVEEADAQPAAWDAAVADAA